MGAGGWGGQSKDKASRAHTQHGTQLWGVHLQLVYPPIQKESRCVLAWPWGTVCYRKHCQKKPKKIRPAHHLPQTRSAPHISGELPEWEAAVIIWEHWVGDTPPYAHASRIHASDHADAARPLCPRKKNCTAEKNPPVTHISRGLQPFRPPQSNDIRPRKRVWDSVELQ